MHSSQTTHANQASYPKMSMTSLVSAPSPFVAVDLDSTHEPTHRKKNCVYPLNILFFDTLIRQCICM